MLDKGFQPIGKDFPVFLDPKSHEEYALARTERKTAKGYHGFAFYADEDVTLEQDLSRRDLTVNAMAIEAEHFDKLSANGSNHLIDPYHGQRDIKQKILRHVTLAFREDPVRILRVARFAARFSDFSIAPETMVLMRGMVANSEADSLVAERIWQEIAKGLMEAKPSRIFEVLQHCGLLQKLLPSLVDNAAALIALDLAANRNHALPVRFATLQLPADALKAPSDCIAISQNLTDKGVQLNNVCKAISNKAFSALDVFNLLQSFDAIRQPERFALILQAASCTHPNIDTAPLTAAVQATLAVASQPIAEAAMKHGLKGEQVGERINAARIQAIKVALL